MPTLSLIHVCCQYVQLIYSYASETSLQKWNHLPQKRRVGVGADRDAGAGADAVGRCLQVTRKTYWEAFQIKWPASHLLPP